MGGEDGDVDHYLSTSQAAERIGITPRHVTRLVNTGAIDIVGHFGIQRQLVFREEDIDAYIDHHTDK